MSPVAAPPLPFFDRNLLRAVEKIVPAQERGEWSRTWRAELWHMHHRAVRNKRAERTVRGKNFGITLDLSIGLVCDALWLRTDSWGRALNGTPALCLASLLGLCLLSTLVGLALNGNWHAFAKYSRGPFERSVFAAVLVVFVSFAMASRGHIESTSKGRFGLKRHVFFAAKATLVLLLACLLSADICRPIYAVFPIWAYALQLLMFVPFALLGLRWAFADQEGRCKQCLRSLGGPARVGRPSHNLLEWNGTELACKQGHGRLNVPEMETSWRDSSEWVYLEPVWD